MSTSSKNVRLIFPQWQGGARAPYYFGSQLLNWLAPETAGTVKTIHVPEPVEEALTVEDGITARAQLLRQSDEAAAILNSEAPDSVVVFGGDCLVDLAPFAYLSEKYGDDFAILWVDAHPDIMTPKQYTNAHAMVLGNLLGQGDDEFRSRVKVPVKPTHVMYAGLEKPSEYEASFIEKFGLRHASGDELAENSNPVLDWIESIGAKHIAVHFDLDVLDPTKFHSLYFHTPDVPSDTYEGIAKGKMSIPQIIRLLQDVNKKADIVGLGIAEYFPWDVIAIKDMLGQLPLLKK
ncbi:arginase family protein [Pseudomonas kurunegalensis]|uniref:arginase family protein n=1 Tax=Pseudomonas kurunegalensis TaxID=485880 RepID=UPI002570095A|nr:arginase family protein [Pseudomonas kurunegalensis]WJD60691.1 arginase family protein [Pseudomonas kurunegalensis]